MAGRGVDLIPAVSGERGDTAVHRDQRMMELFRFREDEKPDAQISQMRTCNLLASRPPFSGTPADVCEKTRRLLASTEYVRFFILYAFYVCICNTMHSTTRLLVDYYAYPVCVCNKHQQLESACRI
jgi:hypothetical protein